MCSQSAKATFKRFGIVVIFSIAFAYVEAAVVVYLRTIFYPAGFTFPLTNFAVGPVWKQLLLTEIGREAATLVIIFTSSWLFGRNSRQRFAYFLTIFANWDIFYYIWLKIMLDWPASIMDWDVLFLIPVTWASPVLAPVIVSITMLAFAVIILRRDCCNRPVGLTRVDLLGFCLAAFVAVLCFCIAGRGITEPDFKSHFHWPLFAIAELIAVALYLKCLLKPK